MILNLEKKSDKRLAFEDSLHRRIVGQDKAVDVVSEIYESYVAGMSDTTRPIGNLLFLGPTGVGKTLLVESIAEALHKDPRHMIKVNCGEYSEEHQMARIIGAPPGYVGHDTAEPLINATSVVRGWVDSGPRICVLLFDEIEKASYKLWQLLLGIMDKAELTTGKNQRLDLHCCWLFLTSNIGSRAINQDHIGFTKKDVVSRFKEISKEAISGAKKIFPPEFMGRVDKTVVFNLLSEEHLKNILALEIGKIWQRVLGCIVTNPADTREMLFTLKVTPKLNSFLLEKGLNNEGARGLRKVVQEYIATPITSIIATRQVTEPGSVVFDLEDGKIAASFEKDEHSIILTDPLPDKSLLNKVVNATPHSDDDINVGGGND